MHSNTVKCTKCQTDVRVYYRCVHGKMILCSNCAKKQGAFDCLNRKCEIYANGEQKCQGCPGKKYKGV